MALQFRLAIQDGGVGFNCVVSYRSELPLPHGRLARLCYYRTNYGKITSIRDRLFQFNQTRPDFRLFLCIRLAVVEARLTRYIKQKELIKHNLFDSCQTWK